MKDELPCWARFLKRRYSEKPKPLGFVLGSLAQYVTQGCNLTNAILAYSEGDYTTFWVLLLGLVWPQMLHAANVYTPMRITDSLKNMATREFLLALFNLDKAVQSWRYASRGEEPRWHDVAAGRLTIVGSGCTLSSCQIIRKLASGNVPPDFGRQHILLVCSLFGMSLGQIFVPSMLHISDEDPARIYKYRLHDLNSRSDIQRQLVCIFLYDVSSIIYRITLFVLVYIFAGPAMYAISLFCAPLILLNGCWPCLRELPLPECVLYIAVLVMLAPYFVYDLILEVQGAMGTFIGHGNYGARVIQILMSVVMIASHWEKIDEFPNQRIVWLTLVTCIFFTTVYLVTVPWLLYNVFADKFHETHRARLAFHQMLCQMQDKKREAARSKPHESDPQGRAGPCETQESTGTASGNHTLDV